MQMNKRLLGIILLIMSLLLSGCHVATDQPNTLLPDDIRPISNETEPTVAFGWTSGKSPMPNKRIGLYRAGLNHVAHAVSPSGIYFFFTDNKETYIVYSDAGSDTIIKLCGRPECTHNTPDCNAYVYDGGALSYYGGYLYAISGNDPFKEMCTLIRIDPDGANHMTVMDFSAYAKENGGAYATIECITEGTCLFSVYSWDETEFVGGTNREPKHMGYYYYKLDGSMKEPSKASTGGLICYNCGDVFLTYLPEAVNGGAYGSYYDWDAETNTATFLTDHPGKAGWFGSNEGYYFKDGFICRLTYATQKEEIMADTGLEGNYYLFAFPDCLVLAENNSPSTDHCLYIYNWSFELLDKVRIPNPTSNRTHFMVIAETSERFILTDEYLGIPKYYINKSELGTGNVEIHEFVYR